ncbi:uncharacterized threonine-rich GPI-anchored glycoprotein PJ4664.02-like isoform X2 [Pararge aegeria]|uniref:uncharacterized threonine-rich GPI-anchored glycoprotein PJ4664.02-like isoform X2 n=1 Tax=Pararge aegeria TaxID=116150 RepID=UPI0019D02D76|nr:uncharacterized threonine-rich GPI-anchored glycoprotein PJ4664.02-like isoform X2 [Pararge aegeria]
MFGPITSLVGTAKFEYEPVFSDEEIYNIYGSTNGSTKIVLQSITCMKEYESKSFEELRLEDCLAGRGGLPWIKSGVFQQTKDKPIFGGSPFGQDATTSEPGAFGQQVTTCASSVFGQLTTTSSASAIGQHATTCAPSVFGQPSTTSAPSAFSQQPMTYASNVFGQPSTTSAPSAFGQQATSYASSVFGQPTTTSAPNAFGQPTITSASSVFGQPTTTSAPSAFGQQATTRAPSVFGQSAITCAPSVFNQPATNVFGGGIGTTSSFGQTSFGQPAKANTSCAFGGGFGSTSCFGRTSQFPCRNMRVNAQTCTPCMPQVGSLFNACMHAGSMHVCVFPCRNQTWEETENCLTSGTKIHTCMFNSNQIYSRNFPKEILGIVYNIFGNARMAFEHALARFDDATKMIENIRIDYLLPLGRTIVITEFNASKDAFDQSVREFALASNAYDFVCINNINVSNIQTFRNAISYLKNAGNKFAKTDAFIKTTSNTTMSSVYYISTITDSGAFYSAKNAIAYANHAIEMARRHLAELFPFETYAAKDRFTFGNVSGSSINPYLSFGSAPNCSETGAKTKSMFGPKPSFLFGTPNKTGPEIPSDPTFGTNPTLSFGSKPTVPFGMNTSTGNNTSAKTNCDPSIGTNQNLSFGTKPSIPFGMNTSTVNNTSSKTNSDQTSGTNPTFSFGINTGTVNNTSAKTNSDPTIGTNPTLSFGTKPSGPFGMNTSTVINTSAKTNSDQTSSTNPTLPFGMNTSTVINTSAKTNSDPTIGTNPTLSFGTKPSGPFGMNTSTVINTSAKTNSDPSIGTNPTLSFGTKPTIPIGINTSTVNNASTYNIKTDRTSFTNTGIALGLPEFDVKADFSNNSGGVVRNMNQNTIAPYSHHIRRDTDQQSLNSRHNSLNFDKGYPISGEISLKGDLNGLNTVFLSLKISKDDPNSENISLKINESGCNTADDSIDIDKVRHISGDTALEIDKKDPNFREINFINDKIAPNNGDTDLTINQFVCNPRNIVKINQDCPNSGDTNFSHDKVGNNSGDAGGRHAQSKIPMTTKGETDSADTGLKIASDGLNCKDTTNRYDADGLKSEDINFKQIDGPNSGDTGRHNAEDASPNSAKDETSAVDVGLKISSDVLNYKDKNLKYHTSELKFGNISLKNIGDPSSEVTGGRNAEDGNPANDDTNSADAGIKIASDTHNCIDTKLNNHSGELIIGNVNLKQVGSPNSEGTGDPNSEEASPKTAKDETTTNASLKINFDALLSKDTNLKYQSHSGKFKWGDINSKNKGDSNSGHTGGKDTCSKSAEDLN